MKQRLLCALILCCSGFVFAQQTGAFYSWIENGKIQHGSGTATFSCNHPDAMLEAVRTVREEYGWTVSFEGAPLFSKYDRVDNTSPQWRATHPNAPGVSRAAGGRFTSTYVEYLDMSKPDAEEAVLSKIVADYNSSGNPGEYALLKLQDGIYDIVGVSVKNEDGMAVSIKPILETPISLPEQERSLFETVDAILGEITRKSGKKAIIMTPTPNILINSSVTIGGEDVPARQLLLKAFSASQRPMLWDFGYDPNPTANLYLLNPMVAMKRQKTSLGATVPVPVDAERHQ